MSLWCGRLLITWMHVSKQFAAPCRITWSPHVPSVIMLARNAAQDEHPSTKWNSSVPSGCKRKMGGNALVHATFQENASLSTTFKADSSTITKYPSHLEKFSSPRPPYWCPKTIKRLPRLLSIPKQSYEKRTFVSIHLLADGQVSKTLLPRRALHQSLIRLHPDVQYLTLLYTIFDKKCTPLRFVQEKVWQSKPRLHLSKQWNGERRRKTLCSTGCPKSSFLYFIGLYLVFQYDWTW